VEENRPKGSVFVLEIPQGGAVEDQAELIRELPGA
jgi:hypothetical protein